MSNRVWAKIDVLRVQTNISAHYLSFKANMSHEESVFCGKFDFGKWRHPAVTLEQFARFSLYTQGNILTESRDTRKRHLKSQIGNRDLLYYAVRTRSGLSCATRELCVDAAFMMSVADAGGCTVYFASDKLKDNNEFILICISGDRFALRDSSARIKDDKQVLLAYFA